MQMWRWLLTQTAVNERSRLKTVSQVWGGSNLYLVHGWQSGLRRFKPLSCPWLRSPWLAWEHCLCLWWDTDIGPPTSRSTATEWSRHKTLRLRRTWNNWSCKYPSDPTQIDNSIHSRSYRSWRWRWPCCCRAEGGRILAPVILAEYSSARSLATLEWSMWNDPFNII